MHQVCTIYLSVFIDELSGSAASGPMIDSYLLNTYDSPPVRFRGPNLIISTIRTFYQNYHHNPPNMEISNFHYHGFIITNDC